MRRASVDSNAGQEGAAGGDKKKGREVVETLAAHRKLLEKLMAEVRP